MLYYTHPVFSQHDTGSHPENAKRLAAIANRLAGSDLLSSCTRPKWEAADHDLLSLVHDADYVNQVAAFAAAGGGRIEADTVVSSKSYEAAALASGAACDAVERVLQGEAKQAFCVQRPPGHHALASAPMGFCLFNHVAVAAAAAVRRHDLDRVLIVDWDVHHGNGTQDAFWIDPTVAFYSMHRWPFYPGSGREEETGSGAGLGATRNLPVAYGTSRRTILDDFRRDFEDFADKMRPQLLLVSAGFDAHRLDPVGDLGLETEDFAAQAKILADVAAEHCDGKLIALLEGGYHPEMLAESVEAVLETWMDYD